MDAAISVRNLGKEYRIKASGRKRYHTLRDDLIETVQNLLQGKLGQSPTESFWAIQDINFEVYPGEVVGIIGRNGAGKSTLLKVLSRVTQPTQGEAILYGRVASLLEVGTGFHPELTGRENIFMSGAVLGMQRSEIRQQFDEIVAFAEVEKFLDTPVKRYSSGMYVRLAFAVAAHLNPEILIVDEVLAVGDAAFQRKCLGRMQDVAGAGRTVLFVSHNMQAVRALCSRAILLEQGRVVADNKTEAVISLYTRNAKEHKLDANSGLGDRLSRTSGAVRFTQIAMQNRDGHEQWDFTMGETLSLQLSYQAFEEVPNLCFYLAFNSSLSQEVVTTFKEVISQTPLKQGETGTIHLELPDISLRPNEYSLYIFLGNLDCNIPYDVLDQNVSLPYLIIHSSEMDNHKTAGYFSHPYHLSIKS